MEGYAGDTVVTIGPELVPIELFDKIDGGSLSFNEVNMALSVSNGNNVPIDVNLGSLVARNTKTGKSINIDLTSLPNQFLFLVLHH